MTLRKATIDDLHLTFGWASSEIVRKYSINQSKITMSHHEEWFKKKLMSEDCLYLIGEVENETIGSLRIDLEGSVGLINFLIEPKLFGRGYGTKIIQRGVLYCKNNTDVKILEAMVIKSNLASRRIFEKLGFNLYEEHKSYLKFNLDLYDN